MPNQYVVYPGNLYHGVLASPAARTQAGPGGDSGKPPELRLTLLINFWDRRPLLPICRDYDGSIYGALQNGYRRDRPIPEPPAPAVSPEPRKEPAPAESAGAMG